MAGGFFLVTLTIGAPDLSFLTDFDVLTFYMIPFFYLEKIIFVRGFDWFANSSASSVI